MGRYPLHPTDYHSPWASAYSSAVSSPLPLPGSKEIFFYPNSIDTRYQWPDSFQNDRSGFSSSLPSHHGCGNEPYYPSTTAVSAQQFSSNTGPELRDMQPQHIHQWQIVQPENTLHSLGTPLAYDDVSDFRSRSDGEDEDATYREPGLMKRTEPRRHSNEFYEGDGVDGEPRQEYSLPEKVDIHAGRYPPLDAASRSRVDLTFFSLELDNCRKKSQASSASVSHSPQDDHNKTHPTLSISEHPPIRDFTGWFDHPAHWASASPLDISGSVSPSSPIAPSPYSSSNKALATNREGAGVTHEDIPTCMNCSTQTTPLWRRTQEGNSMCNACGLFWKLHHVNRPLSLKTDIIKKRKRISVFESPGSGGSITRAARKSRAAPRTVGSEEAPDINARR